MKKILISSAAVALLLIGCNSTPVKQQNTVSAPVKVTGIRQASLTKDSQNLPQVKYVAPPPIPGEVKLFKTSYVTAPPMIPHSIKGLTPIKMGHNQCLACHMPKPAKAMHIVAIPQDHFVNNFANSNFSAKSKNGKYKFVKQNRLAGSRYNCTQCHAPQAKLDPAIENQFEQLQKSRP